MVLQQQEGTLPDKVILVIIDGIGDVTIPAFGDRTPLQVSHTPNMDCISGLHLCYHNACATAYQSDQQVQSIMWLCIRQQC